MTQNTRVSRSGGRGARPSVLLIMALVAVAVGLIATWSIAEGPTPAIVPGARYGSGAGAVPSYTTDVFPILVRSCFRCHGPDRSDKGLRLDSYQRVMAGDSYGAVLIPGDSSLSAMVLVIKNGTMPHESTKLTPAEIETLSKWIDAGAPQN